MLDLITRFVRDFGSKDADVAADLKIASRLPGTTSISDLSSRANALVAGVVIALTQSRAADSPRLTITVSDGTGEVHAEFLGRREISGVRAGALITLEGRFCEREGVLHAHNPIYELVQTRDE